MDGGDKMSLCVFVCIHKSNEDTRKEGSKFDFTIVRIYILSKLERSDGNKCAYISLLINFIFQLFDYSCFYIFVFSYIQYRISADTNQRNDVQRWTVND
jgi:hypothetical protein